MRKVYAAFAAIVVLGAGALLYVNHKQLQNAPLAGNPSTCLTSDERATYTVLKKGQPATVRVSVLDAASTTVWSRDIQVSDSNESVYIYLEHCHIYFSYEENFDAKRGEALPGYIYQVRRLPYFSNATSTILVTLSYNKTGSMADFVNPYSYFYNIDPSEKYIVLVRGNLGDPDYALVFKDIETGQDVHTLSMTDILKNHPRAAGSLDAFYWVERPDGIYLVDTPYDGPRWTALIHIKRDTWETKIYDTPEDYLAGVERSAPSFAPYLAYTNIIVWTGLAEADQALLEQQIAAGLQKKLIVANLATGATTTVAEVPISKDHAFDPTWLNDSTLEYTMPDGSVRTYTVK